MPTPAPWLIAWAFGALVVLALVIVCAYLAHRRIMERGAALITCWWREVSADGVPDDVAAAPDGSTDRGATATPWRRGLLRYDPDGVHLFGSGLLSFKPAHSWTRAAMDLGHSKPAGATDFAGLERPVVVRADVRGQSYDLALSVDHYTALRSWVEALPPGWNANVA